ncbi:heterokaryon incompatibility protein-domain-containing protein [Bipolaris maydis]|nr:heterokaryon incompatibility protein-domain-containing protein [Bipolaris maydis]
MPDAKLYSLLPHRRAIRLLRIKSGTGKKGIQITLETFDLDSKTQFTALSYVWGDATSQRKITCNGHKKLITRNLWGVLSQLKKQRFDCLLWVDAICINQNDEEEKSFQVAMMRDIYKRAAKVIFWLGEQGRYDEDAVNLMREFFKRYPKRLDLERNRVKTLKEMGLSYFDQRWYGWASLCCRPWFRRAWIVQEFLNAKESVFMSGALEISSKLLVHCGYATGVCVAIREAVLGHSTGAHEIEKYILRFQALRIYQFADDIRIFDLWCWSQQLEATDTRDRVFALLSIQTAVNMDMIDYRKDEATVYTEIAIKALSIPVLRITSTGNTVLTSTHRVHTNDMHRVSRFLACKFRSPQSSNLPSWVPDWKPIGFWFVPLTRYYTGTATFTYPYDHAIVKDKTLSISGIFWDEPEIIIDSTPYMDQLSQTIAGKDSDNQKTAIYMLDWMYQCYIEAMSISLRSVEKVDSGRFCHAMAFGVHLEKTVTPDKDYMKGFQALYRKFESLTGKARYHPSFLQSYSEPSCHGEVYESRFSELSAGRKFCVTKKRHLAWVPKETKPTDRICLLAGCAVPFAVRPVGQQYELLGDCYRDDMVEEKGLEIPREPYLFEFL